MEKEIQVIKGLYGEVARKCLDSGMTLPYILRDISSAVAHEAMIRTGGNLSEALDVTGVVKVTFMRYLGMGSKEWNKKYGGKDE